MAKEKAPDLRQRVILELLHRKNYVSKKEIMEYLETRHDIEVKRTTIINDIKCLVDKKGFPIELEPKYNAYYFTEEVDLDDNSQIFLNQEELMALLFYAKTITQYQDYPIFTNISDAIYKVLQNSAVSEQSRKLFESKNLLNTEKHHPIKGLKFIPKLLEAIVERKTVTIIYGKFGKKSKVHDLRPILLKEDKQLWYLLGYPLKEDKDITLAIDRIETVLVNNKTFPKIPFDYEDHFKYSFGITVRKIDPITVVLEFTEQQAEYIKILPIHSTQKEIEDYKDAYRISVEVKPSYEFYSKILSYGPNVKVISPAKIADKFKELHKAAYQNYSDEA